VPRRTAKSTTLFRRRGARTRSCLEVSGHLKGMSGKVKRKIGNLRPWARGRARHRYRRDLAAQEPMESRVGRRQGAFERRDGVLDVRELNGIGVERRERGLVASVSAQLGHDVRPVGRHLGGMVNWPVDLLFQRLRAAIPELLEVQSAVEDGWRVHLADLPVDAHRVRAMIGPAFTEASA